METTKSVQLGLEKGRFKKYHCSKMTYFDKPSENMYRLKKIKIIKEKRGKRNKVEKGRLPLFPNLITFFQDGPDFKDYPIIRDVTPEVVSKKEGCARRTGAFSLNENLI